MFYWDGKQVTIREACVEKYHEAHSDNFSAIKLMEMLSCKTNAAA
jgi:hypothetical protein